MHRSFADGLLPRPDGAETYSETSGNPHVRPSITAWRPHRASPGSRLEIVETEGHGGEVETELTDLRQHAPKCDLRLGYQ